MLKVNLWEVRTAKGLKLEAVAVMTGVSKSTLNNIENGKTSPTLANLEKIAKGLGCRMSDLYDSEYSSISYLSFIPGILVNISTILEMFLKSGTSRKNRNIMDIVKRKGA